MRRVAIDFSILWGHPKALTSRLRNATAWQVILSQRERKQNRTAYLISSSLPPGEADPA